MPKQIITNMKLLLFVIEKKLLGSLKSEIAYKELKIQSKSYRNEVGNLYYVQDNIVDKAILDEINSQKKRLMKLKSKLDNDYTVKLLLNENYIYLKHLTATIPNIDDSIRELNNILINCEYSKNSSLP